MNIIILSGIAGVLGTGIGAILGMFFTKTKQTSINNVLALSGGCMLGMVFFSIYPEVQEISNFINIFLSSILGILLLFLINFLTSVSTKSKIQVFIESHSISKRKSELFKAGIILFIAISAHNIPEGISISSIGYTNYKTALTLALLLLIHNIPEGMAISAPLIAGGMSKTKSLIFSVLAGGATIIGGLIGMAIININPNFSSLALAFSAGAMLNVTFCDIYPEAFSNHKTLPHLFNFVGMFLMFILVNLI